MRRILGFLLGVLLSVPVLAVDCTTGQQPWSATVDSSYTGTGSSAWEACGAAAIARHGSAAYASFQTPSNCFARLASGSTVSGTVSQVCTVPASSGSLGTVTVSVTAGTMTFPDVFQIDSDGGAQIAGAILAVWAVAWGFRMVIRSLDVDGKSSTSESES